MVRAVTQEDHDSTYCVVFTHLFFACRATDAEARTRFAEYPASGCCPKCQIKFMEAPAAAGRGVNIVSAG